MTRSPRLVALQRPLDDHYLPVVRRVWDAGDVVLPLPSGAREASRLIAAFRPDVIAAERDRPGELSFTDVPASGGALSPLPADTALVVATSGTSGTPRGVVLSHGAVQAAVAASLQRLGTAADDRWLCCLPVVHVAGLLVLLRGEAAGGTVVHPGFDVEAIRAALARRRAPTQVSLVPTMLHRLLEAGVDLAGLRTVLLGGAPPGDRLPDRAAAAGVRIVVSYGMTESCGGVVYDGLPLDGVGVGVEPDGRILLSGATMLTCYRDSEGTRSAGMRHGWFPTQDRGRWHSSGRLEMLGRLDDIIVSGGENVGTAAVARALQNHPEVGSAAARGVPDPQWGERVEAWITGEGGSRPALAAILEFVRAELPPAAVPKRLHLVAELPRTPLGKVAAAALEALPVISSWPAQVEDGADGRDRARVT